MARYSARGTATRLIPWLLVLWWCAACASEEHPAPSAHDSYVVPVGYDQQTHKLKIAVVGKTYNAEVDMSGLDYDLDCAKQYQYADESNSSRIGPLRRGCAAIVGASKSDDEREAQELAKREGQGRWDPGFWASVGRRWDDFWSWFGRNWQAVLSVGGIIIAVVALPWVVRAIDRWRRRRHSLQVYIALAGLYSAGKTALWEAWQRGASQPDHTMTAGIVRAPNLRPLEYKGYTLYPDLTDVAGTEPWQLRRIMRKTPRRARRVLMVVLAPRAENAATSPETAVDQDYVMEQRGYLNVVSALVGDEPRVRPHLVVFVVTKFDLLSDAGPESHIASAKEAKQRVDGLFVEHRRIIRKACKEHGVKFAQTIGSSTHQWGIEDIRRSIDMVTP